MNITEPVNERRTLSPGFTYNELIDLPDFLKCLRLHVYLRKVRGNFFLGKTDNLLTRKATEVNSASLFCKLTQIEISALFIQLQSWTIFVALKRKEDPEKNRKVNDAYGQISLYSTDEMLNFPFLNILILIKIKLFGIITNPKNYLNSSLDKTHVLLNFRRDTNIKTCEMLLDLFNSIELYIYKDSEAKWIADALKKITDFRDTGLLEHAFTQKAGAEALSLLDLLKTCLTYPDELLPPLISVSRTSDALDAPNDHFSFLVPPNFMQCFKDLINLYVLLGNRVIEKEGRKKSKQPGSSLELKIKQLRDQIETEEVKKMGRKQNSGKSLSPLETLLKYAKTSSCEVMKQIETTQDTLAKQDLFLVSIPENLFRIDYQKIYACGLEVRIIGTKEFETCQSNFFIFHKLLVVFLKSLNHRFNRGSAILSLWKKKCNELFMIPSHGFHNGLFSPLDLLFLNIQSENLKLLSLESVSRNDKIGLFLLHSDGCNIQRFFNQFIYKKDKVKLLKKIFKKSNFPSTINMENKTPDFHSYISKVEELRKMFGYLTDSSTFDLSPLIIRPIGAPTGQVSAIEESHLNSSLRFIVEKLLFFPKLNLFIDLNPFSDDPALKYFVHCYELYLTEWIKKIKTIPESGNGQPLQLLKQRIHLLLESLFDHVNFIDEFALTYPETENKLAPSRKLLHTHFIAMCEPLKRFSRLDSLNLGKKIPRTRASKQSRKKRRNQKKEVFPPPKQPKPQVSEPLHFCLPRIRLERKQMNPVESNFKEKLQNFELEWSAFSSVAKKTKKLAALCRMLDKIVYAQKDSSLVGVLLKDEIPALLTHLKVSAEDLLILTDFFEKETLDYASVSSSIIKVAFLAEQFLKLLLCQQSHDSSSSLGEILRQHNLSYLYAKIKEFTPAFNLPDEHIVWLESLDPVIKRTGRYGGRGIDPLSAFLSKIHYLVSLEQLPERGKQAQQAMKWINGLLGKPSKKGDSLPTLKQEAWKFLREDFHLFLHQSLDVIKDLMLALDKENLPKAPEIDLEILGNPSQDKADTSFIKAEIDLEHYFHSSLSRLEQFHLRQFTRSARGDDSDLYQLHRLQYGFIHHCKEAFQVVEQLLVRSFPQKCFAAYATTCLLKEGVLLEQLFYVLMGQFPLLHESQNVHVLLSELKNKPYYFCHEIQRSGELLSPYLQDHPESISYLKIRSEILEPILKNLYRNSTPTGQRASNLIAAFRSFDLRVYMNGDLHAQIREDAHSLFTEQVLHPCLETLHHVHLLLIFVEKLSEDALAKES